MYSVVLMMALSGGTEAVDFGHRCSCSCSGSYGCMGGCSGCRGCHGGRRCHGCSGGCYGGGYGCMGGCYGGGYGCMGGCYGGGYGCAGCGGGMMPGAGGAMPYGAPPTMTTPPQMTQGPAPATIIVSVPTNAKLLVDGRPTTSTSNRRTLVTPALEQGSEYVYTLRAEIVREGQTQAQEQIVRVLPGQVTEVPFTFQAQGVASR